MKGLNKLALATAIAAAPFAAQAELKAMDDSSMGNVTGQSGVTIELETQVGIDTVTYTDEGQFNLSNVNIGGGDGDASNGVDGLLDNLKVEIDVAGDGDALIHVGTTETDANGNPEPIDFGVSIGKATLDGTDTNDSTLLASNIGIEGNLAALDIQVDTATDELLVDTSFNVVDMDMTVDFLGVTVEDMQVMGADFFETEGTQANATAAAQFANASLVIAKTTAADGSTEGLGISVDDITADVRVGATIIGGESIGTIAMDNLNVTDTEMVVYGHADGNTQPIRP
ncbi:hypothetical protein C8D92_102301 [Tamilnaduibacter salinus]|uniref:DUF6160 domain-containing protein n=1 Tax=Tamilnaduibacter salinus TaxID=1484056 RepID=A0A2U1CZX8_9GAMM|nr:DUF6160 family protein [Tamilnaduibacter salinus]PVY78261.1 hypothetical protein C8D92_102301 [Tamilnaduibacter salinus]